MINGDFHIPYANHGAGIYKPTKLGVFVRANGQMLVSIPAAWFAYGL